MNTITHAPRILAMLAVTTVCLTATPAVVASPTDAFTADYKVARSGLPLGDAHFRLKPGQRDGCYVYTGHARPNGLVHMFLGDIDNETRFCIVDGQVRPEHFRRHIDGNPDESYTLDFDWSAHTVRYTGKAGDHETYPIKPGTQDPMSLQIAARRWLASNSRDGGLPETHTFHLTDDDGMDSYRVKIRDAGKLDTPAGRFDTIKLARSGDHHHAFTFWLARDADWIPVRIRRLKDGDSRYTFQIQSLSRRGAGKN